MFLFPSSAKTYASTDSKKTPHFKRAPLFHFVRVMRNHQHHLTRYIPCTPVIAALKLTPFLIYFNKSWLLFLFFLPGSEEDLFYDAPSSPIGDLPFFPDNPVSLRSVKKMKSYIKEDAPKNMKDFVMTFEISEVTQLTF